MPLATAPTAPTTPTEARAQLNWLRGCNEVGTEQRKSELRAILRAADEVEETDPAKMLSIATWLEGLADGYAKEGRDFQASENREVAARYRRCAERATQDLARAA